MRSTFFTLIFVSCVVVLCPAQQILQMETVNQARTVRMFKGQTIVFQMKDSPGEWEKGVITGFNLEKQAFRMGLLEYPVTEVAALKMPQKRWIQIIGGNLFLFGVSWLGASAIGDFLYNDDINWKTAGLISGTCTPAGYLLLKPRKVKIGSRHRLRVLDITLPGVDPNAIERLSN